MVVVVVMVVGCRFAVGGVEERHGIQMLQLEIWDIVWDSIPPLLYKWNSAQCVGPYRLLWDRE